MESWGCEYLDLESFKQPVKKFNTLPFYIVEKMVDKKNKAKILQNEMSYIYKLFEDIKTNGIKEPLEITIAPNGCSLTEGNHRFICLEILEKQNIPIIIKTQEHNLKQGGIKSHELNKLLISEYCAI